MGRPRTQINWSQTVSQTFSNIKHNLIAFPEPTRLRTRVIGAPLHAAVTNLITQATISNNSNQEPNNGLASCLQTCGQGSRHKNIKNLYGGINVHLGQLGTNTGEGISRCLTGMQLQYICANSSEVFNQVEYVP